jgi:uncharacterized tellurite resistance protein B-like protein
MQNESTILEGHSDMEKGAYLGAIASLATADREASAEELEHISGLCDAAQLSEQQKQYVLRAATELTGEELNKCLDILKNSELKYSLLTDLMAFAKADDDYNEQEQQSIKKISDYLGINQQQFSLLDQFAEKATQSNVPAEEVAQPTFLSSLGIGDKLKNAGINTNGLFKGLLAVAAPLLLSRMFSRGRTANRSGMGGGMMGGGGGLLGGGLGSLIGMMAGGRGLGSTGGLLGRVLGGRF